MVEKKGLEETPSKFDLKFMLVGSPGSGKTHMCGTYSKGPVHFYMADPGGEKTLHKLLEGRPEESPITVDTFNRRDGHTYETFWQQIQKDAKEGFFDQMAEKSGLVVFESGTSLALLGLDSVAKKNQRQPGAAPNAGGMRRQDWGQRSQWITELIRVINDLPCAVALTVHLKRLVNEETGAVREQLNLPGQLSDNAGNFFDEVYKLQTVVKTKRLCFWADGTFDQAKTRVFTDTTADFKAGDMIMDQLVDAYFKGGKFTSKKSPGQKPEPKTQSKEKSHG